MVDSIQNNNYMTSKEAHFYKPRVIAFCVFGTMMFCNAPMPYWQKS